MAAFSVDVELGGNLGLLEGEEPGGGVLDVDGVVFGLDKDGGRSAAVGMKVQIVEEAVLGVGEVAGIDDHGEVRAAALLIGGVDGVVEAFLVVSADGGGEVTSCGEAEDADALGVDVPLGRVSTDDAEGALCILEGGIGFGIGASAGVLGISAGDAVFDEDAGNAGFVEPVADFGAFEIDGQDAVAPAGEDYDCGAGGFAFRRVENQRGHGDIAEPDERLAGDEVVGRFAGVDFRAEVGGAGGSAGPELERGVAGSWLPGGFLSESNRGNRQSESEGQRAKAHDEDLL